MTRVVSLSEVLECMGACDEARAWVRSTGHERFADTWNACRRAAWMWWLVGMVRVHVPSDAYVSAGNVHWSATFWTNGANEIRAHLPADVMERAILAWWAARGQS